MVRIPYRKYTYLDVKRNLAIVSPSRETREERYLVKTLFSKKLKSNESYKERNKVEPFLTGHP